MARAAVERPSFIAMEPSDDDLTYRLVEAASEVTGLSQAGVLEAFGEHWILYTGEQGYGPMLAAMDDPAAVPRQPGFHALPDRADDAEPAPTVLRL